MGRLGLKSAEDNDDEEDGKGDDHAEVSAPNFPSPLLAAGAYQEETCKMEGGASS